MFALKTGDVDELESLFRRNSGASIPQGSCLNYDAYKAADKCLVLNPVLSEQTAILDHFICMLQIWVASVEYGKKLSQTNPVTTIALANFISCWTRPDITYTVNKLCKYMSNPGPVHWQALKHLIRYLKGTMNLGLFLDSVSTPGLHGYTDASYADCIDTSKSTIGYVFFYGGSVSWFSKLHTFVTTSTNHSESAALAAGSKEAQWLVYLFQELRPLKNIRLFQSSWTIQELYPSSTLLIIKPTSTSGSAITMSVSPRKPKSSHHSALVRSKIWPTFSPNLSGGFQGLASSRCQASIGI